MKYAAVFEKLPRNWCAYVPDLPGCVSTGGTSCGDTSYGDSAFNSAHDPYTD